MLFSKADERSIMDGNGTLQERAADPPEAPDESAGVSGAPDADAGGALRRRLIGMVRAGEVGLKQSATAVTTARGGARLDQSASVALISGGDTSLHLSAAVAAPSLGDLHLDKSAVQWVVSAGDVSFEKSACAAVVAPSVRVEHGVAGVALGRRVEVGEGGRVLFRPLAAAALGIGLGIGLGLVVTAGAGWAGVRAWRRWAGGDGGE